MDWSGVVVEEEGVGWRGVERVRGGVGGSSIHCYVVL